MPAPHPPEHSVCLWNSSRLTNPPCPSFVLLPHSQLLRLDVHHHKQMVPIPHPCPVQQPRRTIEVTRLHIVVNLFFGGSPAPSTKWVDKCVHRSFFCHKSTRLHRLLGTQANKKPDQSRVSFHISTLKIELDVEVAANVEIPCSHLLLLLHDLQSPAR